MQHHCAACEMQKKQSTINVRVCSFWKKNLMKLWSIVIVWLPEHAKNQQSM